MLKHKQYTFFYIFSHATLIKTFTAKYDGVLPRTPQVRPKSEIYTPKQDDEHPNLFHMRSPPPRVRQVRQSWAVLIFCIYLRCRFHIPRQQELGFWIPNVILRLKSRFQSPGYQLPRAKISQILEFGLPCTWGQIWPRIKSLVCSGFIIMNVEEDDQTR